MTDAVTNADSSIQNIKPSPSLETAQHVYEAVDVSNITSMIDLWSPLLDKIKAFMTIADKIAEVHPYAKIAWSALSVIPKASFSQMDRDNQIKQLLESMKDMYILILDAEAAQLGKIASQQKIITKLTLQTTECAYFISAYASEKSFWKRLLNTTISPVDKAIEAYDRTFKNLQDAFQGTAMLQTEIIVFRMLDSVNAIAAEIDLNDMACANNARFDSGKKCLPGTREGILSEITDWARHPIKDNFPCIFFLHGVAGSGKSAIAHTIAKSFHGAKRLGSSYCFDRSQSETLHAGNLFRTISRDLADLDSKWKESLYNIVKADRALRFTNAVEDQFENLFLQPSQETNHIGPILIVIDALDECPDTKHYRQTLLKLLGNSENIKRIPKNFRFLITSRPEPDISKTFQKLQDLHVICRAMSAIDENSTNNDISLFISNELKDLDEELSIRWPNREWHQLLVNKAGGLFQWAYVACHATKDVKTGLTPVRKLQKFLNSGNQLDGLYESILEQVSPTSDQDSMDVYFTVMGAILLAKEPLSISALITLCKPGNIGGDVKSLLRPLGALLHGVTESTVPLRPLHTSFRDYLLNIGRSKAYFVDLDQQHEHFTTMIFNVMSRELKFNICQIETSYQLNKDIKDLDDKVKAHISTQLAYACQFWSHHLCSCTGITALLEKTESFIKEHFLFWLEVLSARRKVGNVSEMLLDAAEWMERYNTNAMWLRDAAIFARAFKTAIIQSIPHIYLSALPFAPKTAIIGKWYRARYPQLLQVDDGGDESWPTTQQVLVGHAAAICCLALSHDGRLILIVSGSLDHTLRLWDPATGSSIHGPLEGHTASVICVAISPDGKFIVSGSDDHTIRLWEPATGTSVYGPLEGHTSWVNCVAISPDGKFIVSGSGDHTLRLWDPATGSSIHGLLEGHIGSVLCVAISPDAKFIVSGSDDSTLRLWDPVTGSSIHEPLKGHTGVVSCVALSPDGKFIVSGSGDSTLRLWDPTTVSGVNVPSVGHTSFPLCVAISPNGKFIVSGSFDHTLRLWDAATGSSIHGPLEGHKEWVGCVAISPDGKFIVSGSADCTIRLWDPATGHSVHSPLEGHKDRVYCVAISPDGKFIVSGSGDHTLRLWDSATGSSIHGPLKGHKGLVTCVAISPDGKFIVSGSADHTLRLWDPATGTSVYGPLESHTHWVHCVAISPDGKFIVSGSSDHTLRLWDSATGSSIHGPLEGHTGHVRCVAISPNGNFIVSGSEDHTIRLWDPTTGSSIHGPLEGHTDSVWCVIISSDGKFIVSASHDHTLRMWDPVTGSTVHGPLEGHTDSVRCAAVSHDGMLLVSGSRDQAIRLWNLPTLPNILCQKTTTTIDLASSCMSNFLTLYSSHVEYIKLQFPLQTAFQ
ncbi:WD40-repeat-containing domain protein [Hysterangium stoloniferum]|nr:WD40-repeat-containing domain protein [Hysterangium stoloniferum]